MNVKTHPELLSDLLVGNFGTLVNDIFNDQRSQTREHFSPKIDLLEDEKKYSLEVALPGVAKESIHVKQENDLLVISGERKASELKVKRHITEIRRGAFKRSVRLPKNALIEKISANYVDGILAIEIPKTEEAKPRHRQAVNTAVKRRA